MNADPIIIEQAFNAPVAEVWKSITDKDEMKQWYFDLEEFKPEEGFEFRFKGGPEDRQYVHICKITEAKIGKKLTYSWRYEGFPGISFVTFELSDLGNKTKLTLTHKGIESFPSDNEDFAKKNFTEGWTDIIQRSLKDFLRKKVAL